MVWSAARELALTERRIVKEEALRIVQLVRIADRMRRGQDTAGAEQVLRDIEEHLTGLRARRASLTVARGF